MAPKKAGPKARQESIARSIGKYSPSEMYHRRGLWLIKKKNKGKFPVHAKKAVPEVKATKSPRFYPAEDAPKPRHRNLVRRPTKLRAGIAPGVVLILLAGRFKGKRVVCLKQLSSGLLLVTGPFKVNGVPLRRVNQAYVIATSTKVDISKAVLTKFDDAYFKKPAAVKTAKTEAGFFAAEKEKKPLPPTLLADQKAVDAALLPGILAVPELKSYLGARFSLSSGVYPHTLKF